MNHNVVFENNRLSQLPLAMFGMCHDVAVNGTAMPIFGKMDVQQRHVKRLLP